MGESESTRVEDDLVSVVIATYYRNETLQYAIESALDQTHGNVEIIVVDDSGEAHARPVVEAYDGIEYIPLDKNRGLPNPWEVGIRIASGEYIQLLDDDDLLREDKLERQLPLFSESVGVVYSGLRHETAGLMRPDGNVRGDVLDEMLQLSAWPCNTVTKLMERSVAIDVLPFRSRHAAAEQGIQIALALRTEFDFVEEPLVYVRDSDDSMGDSLAFIKGKRQVLLEYSDVYDRYPEIRDRILPDVLRQEAYGRLETEGWSPRVTLSLARSVYHAPELRPKDVGECVASLFGTPGFKAGSRLLGALRDENHP